MADTVTAATSLPAEHAEATALGIDAGGWVAMAMLVVIAIALWAKVPSIVAAMLDKKIAGIREQLDTATKLRAEAEALKAEYEAKAKAADTDIAAIREAAHRDAADIVAQAKVDAEALVERRGRMAEDRIAAAERAAIAEVRAKVATAATAAAAALIAERNDAKADTALVDAAISKLG